MERFDLSRPVGDETRRVARALLADAADALHDHHEGLRQRSVHVARRRLKQTRALVGMMQGSAERPRLAREDVALRDIGRRLSVIRDADALAATTGLFAEGSPELRQALEPLQRHLESRRATVETSFRADHLTWAIGEVDAITRRVDRWPVKRLGWPTLVEGLAASYGRGRAAWRRAEDSDRAEDVHELRKRTKDVHYQIELLRAAWPSVLAGMATGIGQLTDVLGAYQDLELLRRLLERDRDHPLRDTDRDEVRARILVDMQRARRRGSAFAAKVYAEKPKAFAARIAAYAIPEDEATLIVLPSVTEPRPEFRPSEG